MPADLLQSVGTNGLTVLKVHLVRIAFTELDLLVVDKSGDLTIRVGCCVAANTKVSYPTSCIGSKD
jgi:hypothetical protein